ncbi:MAG TPA: glycosyltransferase family 39 protein, partial [Patescibacteria group bacterium]
MNKKILIFIISLGFLVRIINPGYPSLLWDEASLGYNAFSILYTGRDEYGKIMPLILKSFGDYKPGLYSYLSLPFIALFGLNALSVRLPSIILGTLTILLTYLLVKTLSPKNERLALLSAAVIAFNPYNIHFSRSAWETNILTFELVLSAYFLFNYFKNYSKKFLIFAAVSIGLTLYTYQAGKMISLFLILIVFSLNLPVILKKIKSLFIYFVLPLFIFTLPIIYGLLFDNQSNRLKVVSLFSYPRNSAEVQQITSETNSFDYQIFHNHLIFFSRNFLLRYFNHYSPRFLAFEGDWQNPRHSAPYIGVILYPSLIFLIIGLMSGLTNISLKTNLFFLLWFLVAPIPSALTRDSVQAVRAMSLSIPLVYFIALGLNVTISYLFRFKTIFRLPVFTAIIIFYLASFVYYSDLYYNHLLKKSPSDNLYGYGQAMNYFISNESHYSNLYFTDFYGQPYIFYLFYSQYPP